jgi:hypothetical protein
MVSDHNYYMHLSNNKQLVSWCQYNVSSRSQHVSMIVGIKQNVNLSKLSDAFQFS